MITETFYLDNDDQMQRVQQYIKANMPTARFKGNPARYKSGTWAVCVTYEIDDINKLSVLLRTFELEKASVVTPPLKPSLWQEIKNILFYKYYAQDTMGLLLLSSIFAWLIIISSGCIIIGYFIFEIINIK